jgi:signal peptidase I
MVRLPRLWLIGILLFSGNAVASAFDETADVWIRGIFTGHSPRAVAVNEADAWREAIECVSRTPDSFILVGTGHSMQPLYRAGTILVLRKADYGDLQRGQTVVYRNENRRTVGHVLIAKARDGWRVQGLNNRTHDGEPVRAENLLGVVVAAFSPTRTAEVQIASARRPAGRAVFLSDHER